jgi:hypothetical protein
MYAVTAQRTKQTMFHKNPVNWLAFLELEEARNIDLNRRSLPQL